MMKNYRLKKLKYPVLSKKKNLEGGFSFLESIVAILVLSMAFAFNLQFLVFLKIENLKQEIQTGAVSLSKEILDDIRYRLSNNIGGVTSGKTQILNKNSFGYDYNADIYVCHTEPTLDAQNTVTTCPTTTDSNIRYIVVQILDKNRNNEKVYTVQTIFTTLQQ
ncbi:type IV pilus modification PilV family protein [Geminocystis sp. CENA526]|uniref:type IV pilus modification PilV family protein n=1 Tax=Geminocystis sp. CENA526 TaxID=1355871 RepID=UPI003D6EB15F